MQNRETVKADCRLVMKRTGKFYLVVPRQAPERGNHARDQLDQERIVAIDPGVRTFATGYAPTGPDTGMAFEWGKADMGRIQRLCHHADQLVSDIAKTSKAKRSRKRRVLWRLHERIRNLVAEVHWKLASFLCSNFTMILLPAFETSNMCKRGKRRLRSKTVRQMLTWSHFRCQQRLISKAEEYGVRFVICDESYTSKTCGKCGILNHKLGGNKRFRCPHCGTCIDRDVNGARNILLRALLV